MSKVLQTPEDFAKTLGGVVVNKQNDPDSFAQNMGGVVVSKTNTTPSINNDPSLDSGSVANIANPVGSFNKQNSTSVPRASLNLVGALGAGAEQAMGIDPNNQVKSLTGIDPQHPISGTSGESLKNSVIGQTIQGIANSSTPKGALDTVKGLYHGIVDSPGKMDEGIRSNNPDTFVSGLGGVAGVSVPTAEGIFNAGKAGYNEATAKQPQFNPDKLSADVTKPIKHIKDIATIHGSDSSYEWKDNLENKIVPNALPDLKQSELEVLNRPLKNTQEYFDILKHSKDKVWNEYKPYLDQGSTISGDDVVNKAIQNYDPSIKANHPQDYTKFVEKVKEAFSGQNLSPAVAQARLSQLNAEANGFYASNSISDMATKAKLAGSQSYLATGNALRDILDQHLPEGGAKVRERYGSIASLIDSMPAPADAGKPLLKAIFSNSAQAMSTRPGFAIARGAMRALTGVSTDSMIRKAFAEVPYKGNPTTSPTVSLTHPLTGEVQTGVPVGPKGQVNQQVQQIQVHPMSPRAVLEGRQPLTIPQHPLETPQVHTGLPLDANHIQNSQPIQQNTAPLPSVKEGNGYPQSGRIQTGITPPRVNTTPTTQQYLYSTESPSDVRYQPSHVSIPQNIPTPPTGQFGQNGLPSGQPMIPPQSETFKKIGKKISTGLKGR